MAGDASDWTLVREVALSDAVLVVARDATGEVAGFASAGPPTDPLAPAAWELYAIDIVPHAYGTGLAADLLSAAVGDRPVLVWVRRDNGRARAFYAKAGFAADGARRAGETTGRPELRLWRPGTDGT
ncbi:GCN5-related N-acetyltransferase (fragment) [Nostocoides japonicum T1-X7]|uniref:GCN5-related N-acetyltransferase n=1 Tax=Nostocoides japonicum T1-X7 TaxID=1194083 RepID=A0A077M153_9MICO